MAKIQPIKIKKAKPRRGHYTFQGGKCQFDNRPKRLRTRQSQKEQAIKNQ